MTSNRKRASKDFVRKVNRTETRSKQNERRSPGASVARQIDRRISGAVMPIIVSNGSLASYQAENAQESAVEALVTADNALGEAERIENVVIPQIVDPLEFEINRSAMTFYQEDAPTVPADIPAERISGPHLWYKTSTGDVYRWDGASSWTIVTDQKTIDLMTALGLSAAEIQSIKDGTNPTINEAVSNAQSEVEYWNTVRFPDLQAAIDLAQATADGRVKIHPGPTQPTGLNDSSDIGDLWYDPNDGQAYRWMGSTDGGWVLIEDSDVANTLLRLNQAEAEIEEIETVTIPGLNTTLTEYVDSEIEAVGLTIDGKNKSVRSPDAPSSTTGYVTGDQWWRYSGTNLLGFWIFDGTAWVSQVIDNNLIAANIDAGKIGVGFLDAARIQAQTIGAEKLLVGDFTNYFNDPTFSHPAGYGAWVKVGNGIERTGTASYAGAYQPHTKIPVVAGDRFRLTANLSLVSGTGGVGARINLRYYNTAGVYTSAVVVGTLTAGANAFEVVIPAGTGFADFGFYDYFTATTAVARIDSVVVRRMVGATLIEDGAITTNKIVAGAITAASGIIGNAAIVAANIGDAQIINAHIQSLSGEKIIANTITAAKLTLTDTTNLVDDPTFSKPLGTDPAVSPWAAVQGGSAPWSIVNVTAKPGVALRFDGATSTGITRRVRGATFTAKEGDKLRLTFQANSTLNRTFLVRIQWTAVNNGTTTFPWPDYILVPSTNNAWQEFTSVVTAPTGAVSGFFEFYGYSDIASGTAFFHYPIIHRMAASELIVDGAIVASKIAAEAIESGKIKAGAILAEHIAAGAVTTAKLTVSDFQNYVDEPLPTNLAGWQTSTGAALPAGYLDATTGEMKFTSTQGDAWNKNLIPVRPGDKFYLAADVRRIGTLSGTPGGLRIRNQANTEIGTFNITPTLDTETYPFEFEVPDDGVTTHIRLRYGTAITAGEIRVKRFEMRRREAGNLIVDGSITGLKINGQTITGENIVAGSITGVALEAETITGDQIATDTLLAKHIKAGQIEANHIKAGSIQVNLLEPAFGDKIVIGTNPSVVAARAAGDAADAHADAVQNDLTEMQTFYSFGPTEARIYSPTVAGDPNSSRFSLSLKSGGIDIIEGSNIVSSWNSGRMIVNQFIGETVTLGSHQITRGASGHTIVKAL